MKVVHNFDSSILSFIFYLENNDRNIYNKNNKKIKMSSNKVNFIMPNSFDINNIHPDLLGLVVILLIYPYVENRILLSFEISKEFAKKFSICGKIIQPINPSLEPRKKITSNTNPSIAFSAGFDSMSALLLMNQKTKVCFLDRIIRIDKSSIYNKDSIYLTLDLLINYDYSVSVIKSDMEYLREPVGFPIDIACGIPNILLADILNIDSIAYGYSNHHAHFLNSNIEYICTGTFQLHTKYSKKEVKPEKTYEFWNSLYQITGLFLEFPIMGITEIMNHKIVLSSHIGQYVQSCMRGKIGKGCNKCIKCFKNNIIKHIEKEKQINNKNLIYFLNNIKESIKKKYGLNLEKMYEICNLESLYIYIMDSYKDDITNPVIETFNSYFKKYNKKMVLGWNNSSRDLISPKYQEQIINNIKRFTQD